MLASIVEKVSSQAFAQFTQQHIFQSLGMSRSRIYNTRRSTQEVIPDYAYGYLYSKSRNQYLLPDSIPTERYVYCLDGMQGDGTVNSTLGDLFKWDRALKNHTLLPETAQQEMLRGQVLMDSANKAYYGYGVMIGQADNQELLSHGGSWPGSSTLPTATLVM